ncbi:MAG: hypothetical protein E7529_02645 [Ruminococcaceae bacterium]|nr:hypothetical protein [Oscillospiraceae bacterium]
MAEKNIHSGHRKRVKANVIKNGFSQLEEHKLLELMLFYSIPREDTNELAHKLINHFGSFEEVFQADVEKLKRVDGVGDNTAVMIAAMGETFNRISKAKPPKKRVYKNTDDLKDLAVTLLKGEKNEKVILMCFDTKKTLKRYTVISEGDESSSEIDMKEIMKNLLDSDSSVAVLAHNHPKSSAEPSGFDVDSTRMVCVTLRKIGYALADHIIVGESGDAYSMHLDQRFSQLFY